MALRSINKQNSPSDGRRAFTFSVAALCVIICFAASAIPVSYTHLTLPTTLGV